MEEDNSSDSSSDIALGQTARDDASTQSSQPQDFSEKLFNKLVHMENKIDNINQKVDSNSRRIQQLSDTTQGASASSKGACSTVINRPDSVIPSVQALQVPHIQEHVDQRMRELGHLPETNTSGRYKSQRGGSEVVWVRKQVDWPQNFVLTGPNKARVSCDSLNPFQFVTGFALQIKKESNLEVKNSMLQYMAELFEDANDFAWSSGQKLPCCRVLPYGGRSV